jgi:hypothetical protein
MTGPPPTGPCLFPPPTSSTVSLSFFFEETRSALNRVATYFFHILAPHDAEQKQTFLQFRV